MNSNARGISRIEKNKKGKRERKEEKRKNRGRKTAEDRVVHSSQPPSFPLIVLLFREDFFTGESISDGISRERKYPPVSRLLHPLPRWNRLPLAPQRFPLFLLDRLAPRSRYIFSKTSSLITPLFLPFFLFFEAFSSKRGGTFLRIVLLLFPFSFSRHFTLSRHLHEVVLRRREVNKGEAREGGGWRVLPGWRSLKTFSAQLGWKASATFASSLFFPSSSNLSPSRVTLISFLDALLLLLGREKEGEASAKRRSVPSHSWRNDGEEGLATMEDRFKLERGVATSRRRGSPPSKHAPSPSFLPLPLPEQTGWRGLHEQERDAGNYLPRWNDGGPEFRRSEVTAYVLTPWRRERAENTRESCWPFVGTSWKTRRYTTNSIRANVLIAEFAAPIVEKLRQCGPRGIVLSLSL